MVVVVGWWRVLIDARYDWYGWRWRFRLSTVTFLPNLTSILIGPTLLVYKYSVSTLRYAITNLVAAELVTILSTLSRCTALSPRRVLRIAGSLFSL